GALPPSVAAAAAAPARLSAAAAAIPAFAARALHHRRLAWAVIAEPVDPVIDALRLSSRQALVAEVERRLAAAVRAGRVPEQDVRLSTPALVGALVEGLIGPLAPDVSDKAATRETVQALTLLALRAVGIVDARARGLVVQAAIPMPNET